MPEWVKRRGRPKEGFFDQARAYQRMGQLIAEHDERLEDEPKRPEAIFDDAANQWLEHLAHGGRAKPSTLRGYSQLLAGPGKARR